MPGEENAHCYERLWKHYPILVYLNLNHYTIQQHDLNLGGLLGPALAIPEFDRLEASDPRLRP